MKNLIIILLALFISSCQKDSLVLNGYEWKLINIYEKKIPDQMSATLIFDSNKGIYEGNSGCNTFSGACSISGETLYFNRLNITYKHCGEISEWEAQLVKALKETEKYEVNAGRLLLLKGDTIVATWR